MFVVKVSSLKRFLIFWLYGKTQRWKSSLLLSCGAPGCRAVLLWRWEQQQICISHHALALGSLCGVPPGLSSEHSCISNDWITTNPFFYCPPSEQANGWTSSGVEEVEIWNLSDSKICKAQSCFFLTDTLHFLSNILKYFLSLLGLEKWFSHKIVTCGIKN